MSSNAVVVLTGPYSATNGGTYQTGDTILLTGSQYSAIPSGDFGVKVSSLAGSGQFLPNYLTGLHTWYDASQITGQSDGASLTQWNDIGGGGHHLTLGGGSGSPVYKASLYNGKAAVRFPGTGVIMQSPSFTALSQPWTAFAVFRASQGSTATEQIFGTLGNGSLQGANSGAYVLNGGSPGNITCSGGVKVNQLVVVTCRFNGTGGNSDIRVNGTLGNAGATSATGTVTRWYVGASSTSSLGLNGDIAELIFYNRLLSDAEVVQVEQYLA